MAQGGESNLAVGNMVQIVDMPEDPINGMTGELMKPVGKGRWSVKVEGQEKSQVIAVSKLQKIVIKGRVAEKPPAKYSIVGTWFDWEPQLMNWNVDNRTFDFTLSIGTDGVESFKILCDEDWDHCVYPDRKDATPYDNHAIQGPDSGGDNEMWTIGRHPSDQAAEGNRFRVTLHITRTSAPAKVEWVNLNPPVDEGARARSASNRRQEDTEGARARQTSREAAALPQRQPDMENTLGDQRSIEEVLACERTARANLAERLERAAKLELVAIEDEGIVRERLDRQKQIEINRDRYRKTIMELEKKPQEEEKMVEVTFCVECGKFAATPLGNGCCAKCWRIWDQIQKQGAESVTIRDDMPAGLRIYLRRLQGEARAARLAEDRANGVTSRASSEDRRSASRRRRVPSVKRNARNASRTRVESTGRHRSISGTRATSATRGSTRATSATRVSSRAASLTRSQEEDNEPDEDWEVWPSDKMLPPVELEPEEPSATKQVKVEVTEKIAEPEKVAAPEATKQVKVEVTEKIAEPEKVAAPEDTKEVEVSDKPAEVTEKTPEPAKAAGEE